MTNDEFYASLLRWRNRLALSVNKIPPQILHNSTLRAIADLRPQNRKELGKIKGMGPCKMREYADTLLEAAGKLGPSITPLVEKKPVERISSEDEEYLLKYEEALKEIVELLPSQGEEMIALAKKALE